MINQNVWWRFLNKSILEHQINCLRECKISDITVITGYRSEKNKFPKYQLCKK